MLLLLYATTSGSFFFFFFVVSFATSFVLTGMQPWSWSSWILGLFNGEAALRCGLRCIATRYLPQSINYQGFYAKCKWNVIVIRAHVCLRKCGSNTKGIMYEA